LKELIIGTLEGCENVEEKVLFVDNNKKEKKPEKKTEKEEGSSFNVMFVIIPIAVSILLFVYFK
jgi:hypothetical protein